MIYRLYTDDSIIVEPDPSEINETIAEIWVGVLEIEVEGEVQDFLGINSTYQPDSSIKFSQTQLINQILKVLHLEDNLHLDP